jgi:hypothetical protein
MAFTFSQGNLESLQAAHPCRSGDSPLDLLADNMQGRSVALGRPRRGARRWADDQQLPAVMCGSQPPEQDLATSGGMHGGGLTSCSCLAGAVRYAS